MKKNMYIIYTLSFIVIIGILSCGKKEENKPLKETQIYGLENHFPTRNLLSFLPQPDTLALVSPSLEGIINLFFKIDNFKSNEISNSLKKDPILSSIIKDDKEKTVENLNSLGIDTHQPCAFFYTLDKGWETIIKGDNINALTRLFPNAKKTTLRTSWTWFITGKLFAYWDKKSNIGFTSHNGHTFLSNNMELFIKSISGDTPPPSFHYGLDGKPVASSDETVILLSISDELKSLINNPKRSFEPGWLKGLILALDPDFDEICAVINPEDTFHEISIAIHPKQKLANNLKTPELKLFQFLPENYLVKFDLALSNGLKNFLMQLARYNSSGELKKDLGRAVSFICSPLFQDELSIGVLSPPEGDIPDIIFMTMSNQIDTLKNLLGIVAKPDEPIGDFDILKAELEQLIKVPLDLYVGLKNPHVIITNKKEQLSEIINRIAQTQYEGNTQEIQNICPYGFIVNDTNAIKTFFNNNPDLLTIEAVDILSKILPTISEICMYNNETQYLLKFKVII